jgi:hypothetical protein
MTEVILGGKAQPDVRKEKAAGIGFWQEQIQAFKKGRLSGKAFCRQVGLKYDRLQYWRDKLGSKKPSVRGEKKSSFIPIMADLSRVEREPKVLGTLILPKGRRLRIYDRQVLHDYLLGIS